MRGDCAAPRWAALPRGTRKAGTTTQMKPPAKTTVEECLVLDVQELARRGYLRPGLESRELRFMREDKLVLAARPLVSG